MVKKSFLDLILSVVLFVNFAQSNSVFELDSYPEQIHLSYGLPDQMIGLYIINTVCCI